MDPKPPEKIPYTHPALDVIQQIELLKSKGLVIADEEAAKYWLSHISYFRFKRYSYQFKDYEKNDGNYFPDTPFEAIRDLYVFDRKLKMILFEALENIEISVKTLLSNIMSLAYGTHWYMYPEHFLTEEDRRQIIRNAKKQEDIPKAFDHTAFLDDILAELEDPSEIFLKQYKKTYEPLFPPSWMMMEIITFGTLSLMFENLKPSEEKNAICETFRLTKKHLVSWLHCFSFIRNMCAHHRRLVFSKIIFAPALPQRKNRQFLKEAELIRNDSLYAVVCCVQYMLSVCNTDSLFKEGIKKIIEEFPAIKYEQLGFTPHWKDEDIWK